MPVFHLYQLIVSGIAVLMIVQGAIKYFTRGESQSFLKFFVRLFIWGGMAIVALFPQITNTLASFVGLEGNINAVILTAFLLVFLMIFKILSVVERIEQNISTLTRNDALSNLPPKK
ncbi:MAG TPA: DUF2304 domain-containing protein [Candidatus Andersenbacteria bacterium]|nr:DUF2304 domain-containing protein [Candidatus Andersenbacteria bacterium]